MPRIYRREFLRTAAPCLGAPGFAEDSWGAQVSRVDAGSSKAASAGATGINLNQIGFLPVSPEITTVSGRANETIISCNAPLVFILAALHGQ